jgi:transcriptional regulatory protein GAL4
MMLWRGGQRSSRIRSRSEVATQNCILVALETVESICNFCSANERLHQGLSWYATYFLFQAVLVIDFGLLQSPEDEQAKLWRMAINQARQCFLQLGITNPAALRCISVLDRIHQHHISAASNPGTAPQSPGPNAFSESTDLNFGQIDYTAHQGYPADPALQFFLDGAPMTNLFDGVYGFPSTNEQDNFDYIPGDFYNMEDFDIPLGWNENQS